MSDNGYTPSMDEVRDNYVVSRTRNFAEYYAGMDFPSAVDCSSAEFNRALAAHDREVAAKALTDAAHALPDNIYDLRQVADWLRARAAALSTPEQEEER